MKNQVPHSIKEMANIAARIPFVKTILKPFYYNYKHRLEEKRKAQFRMCAKEALFAFDKCLTENGFNYVLAFGTMLGAVREKGFIKHDIDIDVSMWAEDYSPKLKECLEKSGFKLGYSFEVENGFLGREETYVYKDVSIDIFYFYPAIDEYPYCCDFIGWPDCPTYQSCMKKHGGALPRRIEIPINKDRIKTRFEDMELYIPKNANEILEFRYGVDYMVPKKNWSISSYNKHIVEWTEKLGVFKEYV